MKFKTEYKIVPSSLHLDPSRPVVLVGSCFATNIASKMHECMWDSFNGVGTLYNPMSIEKVLKLMIFGDDCQYEFESSIFESDGRVHSWFFDSHFSALSKEKCIETFENSRKVLLDSLDKAQALIVTFGTSWCYALSDEASSLSYSKDGNKEYIVANCHKMPASMFRRRRVSVDEIAELWMGFCNALKQKYPELTIIFTVSPVRHLKDGFEGNALSKATLLLAVEKICDMVPDCIYFPAYEIVCDDLRDYRFYASDLVHPSESAIEYIWEIFCGTFLDEKAMIKIKEGYKKFKLSNHRKIMQ